MAGSIVGCDHIRVIETDESLPYAHRIDDFLPLNGNQKKATFTADGTKTNYTLNTRQEGTATIFQAISAGSVVDEEIYEVSNKSVLLKRAVGENFDPPVVLLKFPLRVGDQYKWKGKIACDLEKLEATASCITSTDYVPLKDRSEDAIKVEMNLMFGKGASRKLSFWFVKGRGILKTQMIKNCREPMQ
jgi:hypothetical protein